MVKICEKWSKDVGPEIFPRYRANGYEKKQRNHSWVNHPFFGTGA
jgi:hypothetical protein